MKFIQVLLIGLIILLIGFGFVWVWSSSPIEMDQAISANLVGNLSATDGFTRADGSHTWEFPTDFGPHPDYQTEWWYYTGNLQTADGRRFGYQFSVFRRALTPSDAVMERDSAWAGNQVYMGHFAVSDVFEEEHYAFERFSRGAAGLAGAQAEPFQVWLENWEVIQQSDNLWAMQAEQDGIGIDLVLTDEKGITFQGINGYSQKGPELGNASYYFSQTRLNSSGVVEINDKLFQVTGLSWMDHEFSTRALSTGQVGWDWYSLQLDEGTDLMVFQIRRSDGSIDPYSSGTLIKSNGETYRLAREDFTIDVVDTWRSPQSGATYPAAWTINIPQFDLLMEITPFISDQEMNVSYAYWEGAVELQGTFDGQEVSGSGYIEMTGYAGSMEGEF